MGSEPTAGSAFAISSRFADGWIKPNAGVPEMVGNVTLYKTTAVEFAASAHELVEAGATFLGGCCGTTPEFIRVLAQQPAVSKAASATVSKVC